MNHTCIAPLSVLLIGTLLPAQTNWLLRSPATSPSALSGHAMAYDSARDRVVLFGGTAASGNVSDTWEWDGTNWAQRYSIASPSKRTVHVMAYDSARGRVVLFGGLNGSTLLGDTWEWDGSNWSQQSPVTNPSARYQHKMAYDSARGRVVLFGGIGIGGYRPETWEWDGTNWGQRNPATSPPARAAHAMAYDSARGRTVLFGGNVGSSIFSSETWEWDGTTWSQRNPAASPLGRCNHAMAYDAARRRTVLFAGSPNGPSFNDTWEWDGSLWIQRSPAAIPPVNYFHAMAWDTVRSRVVLFGGAPQAGPYFADTREYVALNPATCTSFGTGCPGSGGTPALGSDQGSLPWIGDTFASRLSNLGPSASLNLPFLVLGDSKALWLGIPLPLDLSFLNMPGCSLHTNPLVTFPLTNLGGTALWAVPIPNDPSYVGVSLFLQGAVTSPGANPFGMVMSNACELRFGAK